MVELLTPIILATAFLVILRRVLQAIFKLSQEDFI